MSEVTGSMCKYGFILSEKYNVYMYVCMYELTDATRIYIIAYFLNYVCIYIY